MIATLTVVFREVLEAALIVGILLAACRTVPGRITFVLAGIAGGLLGAVALAIGAEAVSEAAQGMGQELLNAAILSLAVLMLGWHSIWMSSHGQALARQASAIGKSVADGQTSLVALSIAIAVTVLREGTETALFLMGLAASGSVGLYEVLAGGAIGALLGIAAGAGIYLGLLRIPLRHLFKATNALIIVVTAGLAAQAAGFLVQAGWLPPLVDPLWNTSSLLSEHSLLGKVLHALIGYVARPSGAQVIAYLATLTVLVTFSSRRRPQHPQTPEPTMRRPVAAVALAAVVMTGALVASTDARAEFKLRYPNIDYREVEVEHNFSATFDKRPEKRNNLSFPTEIGVGILPFWFAEVEFEAEKVPGERTALNAITFENYFMLTEPGKYWLDMALFLEYARATHKSTDADSAMLGVLLQKQDGKFLHTANLYWEKEVGSLANNADTFKYAWQSRYMLHPLFQPGFEVYGEIADLNHPGRFNEQEFRLGPMFAGSFNLGEVGGRGKIKYEAGYLFGATSETERGAVRTRFEYEIGF